MGYPIKSEGIPITDLLTTFEAATRLRMSRQTLAKWRLAGFGPKFIRCGRKILYRREDLTRWLETRTATSTSEAEA